MGYNYIIISWMEYKHWNLPPSWLSRLDCWDKPREHFLKKCNIINNEPV